MQSAIEIKDLSVMLDKHSMALQDITVDLPAGKIIGLIGPSGAGKTTLIRCLVGRQTITKGTVTIFGLPAGSAKLRSDCSYMTQSLSVYPDLTVTENLRYFATMLGMGGGQVKTAVIAALEQVDLTAHAVRLVGDLSGGQKQRVSLAIALLGTPKLLVLDEPTVGLDPVLREQLWKLFSELASEGTTILVASHVMDEASRCDDLLLLRDGTLLAHAAPKVLCEQTQSNSIEESFIKLVGAKA